MSARRPGEPHGSDDRRCQWRDQAEALVDLERGIQLYALLLADL